jgi:hypothetical protein
LKRASGVGAENRFYGNMYTRQPLHYFDIYAIIARVLIGWKRPSSGRKSMLVLEKVVEVLLYYPKELAKAIADLLGFKTGPSK